MHSQLQRSQDLYPCSSQHRTDETVYASIQKNRIGRVPRLENSAGGCARRVVGGTTRGGGQMTRRCRWTCLIGAMPCLPADLGLFRSIIPPEVEVYLADAVGVDLRRGGQHPQKWTKTTKKARVSLSSSIFTCRHRRTAPPSHIPQHGTSRQKRENARTPYFATQATRHHHPPCLLPPCSTLAVPRMLCLRGHNFGIPSRASQ